MKKQRKNKGFTIVELIVVMAIIAVLILIAVPTLTKYLEDANKTSELGSANSIYKSAIATITSESLSGDVADDQLTEITKSVVAGVSNSINANELTVDVYEYATDEPALADGDATKWVVLYPTDGTNIDPAEDIYVISPNAKDTERNRYKNGALDNPTP